MAIKSENELKLSQAAGINNPFVKDWKKNFCTDAKKKIACIPFMRNIVGFTKGETDPTLYQAHLASALEARLRHYHSERSRRRFQCYVRVQDKVSQR